MEYRMRMRMCQSVLIALLLSAPCVAEDPLAIPIDGEPLAAKLVKVTGDELQFAGTKNTSIAIRDFVRYGAFVEPRRGPLWLLADGGSLVASLAGLKDDTLTGDSALLGEISLGVTSVRGIILRLPGDRSRQDALARQITANRPESDRVILDNGDEISGTIESISEEDVAIDSGSGKVKVEMTRVAAMAFNPSLVEKPKLPATYLMIGLSDGSRLIVEKLASDDGGIKFASLGKTWQARAGALVALQVFGGRAVYLSDLKELSYKHVPYLSVEWPLAKDANVRQEPLRISEQRYLKGLGMHTAARVAYKLDQPYASFQAELAIDDSAEGRGSATCSIFVDDGSGKWQQRYTSPIIRGGEKPVPVRVDLTGVKAISLLADFADLGDTLDHIDWLDARLVK